MPTTPTDPVTTEAACSCEARRRADNLEVALRSSRQIGMAMGIVMNTYKVSDHLAFEMLTAVSQHHHRKLRDLAEDVIATGSLDWVVGQPSY